MVKMVTASISETAFNCPHCGALAEQRWLATHGVRNSRDSRIPIVFDKNADAYEIYGHIEQEDVRDKLINFVERMRPGDPFIEKDKSSIASNISILNLNISECFNCEKLAVWVGQRMVYPDVCFAVEPNEDLPSDIRSEFEEAARVLSVSPRSSAALLRLCIQKLCVCLGQPGNNLNKDIGALVEAGLDPRVQKALDTVRVVGNNAVHPGSLDLKDDRKTAESLFRLINLIADKTISEPKHIEEVYGRLPENALDAIKRRDAKD